MKTPVFVDMCYVLPAFSTKSPVFVETCSIRFVHEKVDICGRGKTKAPQKCGAYTKTQNIDIF